MSYKDRIARMLEQGVLTEEQAQRLSNSLSHAPKIKRSRPQRRGQVWLIWITSCLLMGIVIWSLMASSPEIASSVTEVQDVAAVLNQPQEVGNMGKSLTGGLSVALFILIPLLLMLLWFVLLHNKLVEKEEAVFGSWAQVESNYQRRADLIPNMLETVEKYMRFEQKTLTSVIDKRSQAMRPEVFSPKDANLFRDAMEKISKAQDTSSRVMQGIETAPQNDAELESLLLAEKTLGSAMHRILALSENYPMLRSSEQMSTLQAELEGSENRINVARMRFNETATDFNAAIRRMPSSLVASIGGFKRKAYFQADTGARTAVQLKFDE